MSYTRSSEPIIQVASFVWAFSIKYFVQSKSNAQQVTNTRAEGLTQCGPLRAVSHDSSFHRSIDPPTTNHARSSRVERDPEYRLGSDQSEHSRAEAGAGFHQPSTRLTRESVHGLLCKLEHRVLERLLLVSIFTQTKTRTCGQRQSNPNTRRAKQPDALPRSQAHPGKRRGDVDVRQQHTASRLVS